MNFTPAFLASLMMLPLTVSAGSRDFYDQKAEGWFWKRALPEKPAETHPAPHSEETHQTHAPATEEPRPLSSAWFRKHLGAVRDQALDDPSRENVWRYFRLQKIMLDKAERFSEMAGSLSMFDPALDENAHRPIAPFGAAIRRQESERAGAKILDILSGSTGILFVYRSDCPHCHRMVPILNLLVREHDFHLYAHALDGKLLPGLEGSKTVNPAGLSGRIQVEATPALFLMLPGRGFHLLAQGSLSLPDLISRLSSFGHAMGLIPDPLYEAARGARSPDNPEEQALQDPSLLEGLPK